MKNPFRFFVELIQQPVLVPAWVFILMIVNLVSVVFWDKALAKLIFVTFMLSAILMMGLYSRFGFEKILGLGHILWIPLLVYVLVRLPSFDGSFRIYLITLSITIGISLVLDTIDVWRYFSTRRNA
jgi:hypothetical protein